MIITKNKFKKKNVEPGKLDDTDEARERLILRLRKQDEFSKNDKISIVEENYQNFFYYI